ncbi:MULTISPECIES: sigma-70 family RNA polymerase sigma factor [Halomonadaceae]|jgi:RNA polymerase sigma-19 factor, ECF subfamily|uniref:RNA polymerase sigma factor FecI n=1 Tax=Vreelandella titanicae TaxID=664683 RepID=A0A654B572_9GAMM|nr:MULTISPECIES: sigma-70 family RNA polymerase sigma factor [Halomonas]MCD1586662.1 sigma-70 family RNA polymerase sigma factor [Halomonas sp. IOP_14]QKS27327.1 putative RNA polymerase sigma factor FecI [Halomonas titanicae]QNU62704.1 sigma-70 family RNA polymerase sigma factor [Halomonas titanicae]TMU27152.1 sigma-70 family RNA polymerase sigma factor [Halomonas sp. ATBC28]CAD5275146.1 RNA polymerase, sigma 19 factor; KpLE2 phage-like element [Halomonas sp. 156]|tara:strand:- start:2219 stop:2743 length:525 start_codon:yes stop_codon:yes gene_type:complete
MPVSAENTPLAEMYNAHHGWLQRWLQRKTGCSWQAADLAQDTFLRILTSPSNADQISKLHEPRNFLTTIARRVWVDFVRRDALEKAWLEALKHQPEPVVVSPEEQALILETLFQIDEMLEGLGNKVSQAFLLCHLEGLRYAEIAERLGVSVSSVKKYMAKATEHCLLLMFEEPL